jgi:hypothetical protein
MHLRHYNISLLRKSTALFWLITLLTSSFAFVGFVGLNTAYAQTDNNGCQKLTAANVSASGFDDQSVVPSNVLDSNFNTRWSKQGLGEYIQFDLGRPERVCNIDIAWYEGGSRSYIFVVSVSDDGAQFRPIAAGKSTEQTDSLERYNIPDVTARYVRVTVYGSDENSESSITEMAVYGQTQSCTIPTIASVTAIGSDANLPQNTLDNNLNTRWSNLGFPSWIEYDLGTSKPICDVDISWYRGNFRINTFTISASNDKVNYQTIFTGQSSGNSISLERYDVTDTNARYVRITVTGNTENNWASISEVEINGESGTTPLPPPPPPPPVTEICNNGIDDDGDGLIDSADPDCATPPPPSGDIDEFGIKKLYPDGNFRTSVPFIVGRQDGVSNRWNAASDRGDIRIPSPTEYINYEVTGYIKVNDNFDGFNLKYWGPHHGSSGIPFDDVRNQAGELTPCCWYDLGIDSNGVVQTEVEFPHPDNYDKPNPGPIQNVGTSLVNKWIGVKWIVYKIPNSDSRKVELWWDRGGIDSTGKPANQWEILVNKVDNGDWLRSDYSPPNQQEVELRIRDVNPSAIEVRHLYVRDITPPSSSPPPPPPPVTEICNNGIDDDGDGLIDSADPDCATPPPPPPPPPGSGVDPFGIRKIYPTKQGGEEWFMDMTDGSDARSNPPSLTKNSDGSFKVTSGQVRYGVFTSSGYNPDEIDTLDQAELVAKGYMQSPNDWRDFEQTGYVKVNEGDQDENFAWYGRGGRHTGNGFPEGCEGTAYKPALFYDGRTRFAKEQWHVSYVFTNHKSAIPGGIFGEWVGFKAMQWNAVENGNTVVKMEIWLDKNQDGNEDGPWEKVDEHTDRGGWGDEGEECGGEPDQILTWGGPIVTFRWDGASDVDIKNFSVREIQPPT